MKKYYRIFSFFLTICSVIIYSQANANLVLHFDANNSNSYGGAGSIINDLSSSGNNLRIINNVNYSTSNGISFFNFGGSSDYLELENTPFINNPIGSSGYTIIAKLRIVDNSIERHILSMGRGSTSFNGEFILEQTSSGNIRFWDYYNGYGFNDNSNSDSDFIIDDGNWKYITFVKSGSVGKYYLDGVLQNSINAQGNLSYLNSIIYINVNIITSLCLIIR